MKKMFIASCIAASAIMSGCASSSQQAEPRFVDRVVQQNILNYNDNIREMEEYNSRKK